jgi:hypothetical protein
MIHNFQYLTAITVFRYANFTKTAVTLKPRYSDRSAAGCKTLLCRMYRWNSRGVSTSIRAGFGVR